ncbi:hypothetical protein [Rariglobus hedericola]|uniref:hypothetical protein n=1 Tax=Rariglobus hedericola TaxID=2597822 RepID=UPI001EF0F4DD|nr:hypothetical protein [Rariglobus hedericola]
MSRQRLQIVLLTVGAIAVYVGFRALPTGTNLHQVDFDTRGKGMVELCDPSNPQFVAVTTARSPVTMTLQGELPAVPGRESKLTLTLVTMTGKAVGPADVLVQHTRKLHLLVVDPTLRDYQHIHPEPAAKDGDWSFSFTPRLAGTYRVFADFVPVPTARSLYAGADLPVTGEVAVNMNILSWDAEVEGYQFKLTPAAPIHAGKVADLTFTVTRPDGGVVPMEPVMDAYAHLVAFDQGHSGFAHLHPNEISLTPPPDEKHPKLTFKITIPNPGVYVIWAQVKLAGREVFAPFWFEVAP